MPGDAAAGHRLALQGRGKKNEGGPKTALGIGSIQVAGGLAPTIMESSFHGVPGFASALLDATNQFLFSPLDILQIIVSELGPFLFQLSLDYIPIPFDF